MLDVILDWTAVLHEFLYEIYNISKLNFLPKKKTSAVLWRASYQTDALPDSGFSFFVRVLFQFYLFIFVNNDDEKRKKK